MGIGNAGLGPAGLTVIEVVDTQIIPANLSQTSDPAHVRPFYADNLGDPSRVVICNMLTGTSVKVISYSFADGAWFFNGPVDVIDENVALNFNTPSKQRMNTFCIDNPGSHVGPVLFVSQVSGGNTLAMDSLAAPNGLRSTMTAVPVTIAGANSPPVASGIATMSVPITVNRIMTFSGQDIYFGDITGDAVGFTITYDDPPKLTWSPDVDISGTGSSAYSGACIGSQVVIIRAGAAPTTNPATSAAAWRIDLAGVIQFELNPFALGGMGTWLDQGSFSHAAVFAKDGDFKILSPFGTPAPERPAAYMVSGFQPGAVPTGPAAKMLKGPSK